MKKILLIASFILTVGCSTNEDAEGETSQCFRVTNIVYNSNGDFIKVDVNGQIVTYYVQNANDYRLNQMICNLNDIQ